MYLPSKRTNQNNFLLLQGEVDGFLHKKNQLVAATTHITIFIGNARMFDNLPEKNGTFLMRFSWARPNARRSGFESFCRSFFFITKRKKTHYCNLLYDFFDF
jgi:hypothetical protein